MPKETYGELCSDPFHDSSDPRLREMEISSALLLWRIEFYLRDEYLKGNNRY